MCGGLLCHVSLSILALFLCVLERQGGGMSDIFSYMTFK